MENFDELLLNPDETTYSFSKYFTMESNGELVPDIRLNENDRNRVIKTIELYGLNKYGRPEERVKELQKDNKDKSGIYRFIYL